jgi:homoserine dehydrogenase
MTVAQHPYDDAATARAPRHGSRDIHLGLLGLGVVGSAVARLARAQPAALGRRVRIAAALVRDPASRPRVPDVTLTVDPHAVFAAGPDVIVEVLGGLEPARTLVLEALRRRVPVVTANKSLLAHHGDEILEAAACAGVPLCYEASVIAGVPFLDTLARRPLASALTALTGIVNGTSNFVLSVMDRTGVDYRTALDGAQRLGFAEPEPANDIDGIDAVEKLTILLGQFTSRRVAPEAIETSGIRHVSAHDLAHARDFGGTIKPVVHATWSQESIEAFAGAAFVPAGHPLAALQDAANGICLRDRSGSRLCFTGPGAGPDPTSVTILDDVVEATRGRAAAWCPRPVGSVSAPVTAWLVRLTSQRALPDGAEITDLLGAHGAWIQRASALDSRDGRDAMWLLTFPCTRPRIEAATAALCGAAGCAAVLLRALSSEDHA